MLGSIIRLLNVSLALLRPAVFLAGALTAIVAAGSYAVRTRRLSPFSPLARLLRTRVDPWLIAPMERRIVRAGGTPAAAPWWTLAAVVIGGLLLLSAIEFVRDQLTQMVFASVTGSLLGLIIRWTFGVLQIALFARVVASWVGGSPYSKWWRWAFQLTEPFLAPLRQVIPPLGMLDITVLIAYFGLQFLERLLLSVV